ncbi:flagellar motor switch protein FliG [Treponema phagedenis]|uniref:Flagellar motor switch protein FliG n=1 Tax=Treponema phagedenis TaxID=162 RepID=A0A0B7GRG0_TREPH|nr:FliG C-terminal domain-containing protein [Treponema phagedenis]NVP24712.1 flagellar motor switch protein FliG [Treponema phagedenis]QEJ95757.1 flagellar motor switch protein FliG [Treponema phagedenis]QEJ98829.1 flagellar motor switch protein FliG [Treponema phagedenis]QEK00480.1 flagellar motor switch protein FliG [Treponema phagedenis]QEK04334.1 flagellar motor switch protein FliG [Treponema phagedenis]
MTDIESEMLKRGLIKVPSADQKTESSYRKVAKFLYLIGVEQAAQVLKQLKPEQIDKVVTELVTIRHIDKDEATYILSEFSALYESSKNSLGGIQTAESMLTKAFGAEKASEILKAAVPEKQTKPFEFLDSADVEKIAQLLDKELPATKTLVISQLRPKLAAEYIKTLPAEEKKDIILRLAKLKTILPEVFRQVSNSMQEKYQRLQTGKTDLIDGRAVLAEILRKIDPATEHDILQNLSDSNPELEQNIRERLFTLEDILGINNSYLQKKLSTLTDDTVAKLITGKHEAFIEKILSNVSKNRAYYIQDEKKTNPSTLKEVNEVTNQFLTELRRAWERGEFIIEGRDEEWVP